MERSATPSFLVGMSVGEFVLYNEVCFNMI